MMEGSAGSRVTAGVRIAAGAAGVPLPGSSRIPLAIGALVAGAAALGAMFLLLMLMTLMGAGGLGDLAGTTETVEVTDAPSALAQAEIPPEYLRLYEAAAKRYGLDWAILAGIGKVECDHGRNPAPSCTKEGAENSAGAGGPMQFEAATWAEYGVDAEGQSGSPDRWNPADAIFSAANYLHASGAPGDYKKAIFTYNKETAYVEEVESWAAKYRGSSSSSAQPAGGAGGGVRVSGSSPTPIEFIPGERAELDPTDGHLALIPEGVPATVQAMLVAGNELQELPYGPGGHPDPRGATEEDCSSTVNYVLYRSGVRPIDEIIKDNPLAQDYPTWGDPGPGRWVTIYATAGPEPHVFMVIAGLRLDTVFGEGTDVGPNRNESGPRWRILSYIPTWAKWSVRHPPGL
jgi:Transglycosylase SLT domain